jgi:segregation and condensation protein B
VEHREIVEKQAEPPIADLVEQLADPTLQASLEANRAESDAALDELEQAMARAESATHAAAAALQPKPDPEAGPGPAGGPPSAGPGTP